MPTIRFFSKAIAASALLVLFCAPLFSQQNRGTILGLVTDQSGAAVPGATIHVRNMATGILTTSRSEPTGTYDVPFLPPGTYRVSVKAKGFSTAVSSPAILHAQQALRLDFALKVGAVTQAVTVQAQASMLQTANTATGQVIGSQVVAQLPLLNRNLASVTLLGPGVTSSNNIIDNAVSAITSGGVSTTADGLRSSSDGFSIDGANVNIGMYNAAYAPVPDAVEEVNVQTGNLPAEYGQFAGAHVDYVLKSGTNSFHGAAWEFLQNNDLNARSYFQPTVPTLRRNQFGGMLSGPIQKNKTFFMATYEGVREATQVFDQGIVPTVAQRGGDLSLTTAGTPAGPIIDPTTGLPFPGNIIPSDRISPQAAAALKYLAPLPTRSAAVNWAEFVPTPSGSDSVLSKVDHSFSERDQLSVRYMIVNAHQNPVLAASGVGNYALNYESQRFQNAALIETHTFSPTAVLASRVSWNRVYFVQTYPQVTPNLDTRTLFDMVIPSSIGPGDIMNAYPNFQISGYSSLGNAGNAPTYQPDENYEIASDLALIKGKHRIKTGFALFRYRSARFVNYDTNGILAFAPTNPAGTGNAFADFLLGLPSSAYIANHAVTVDLRHTETDFYIQDQWLATPKLTVNAGLRYELDTPVNEHFGRISLFNFTPPGSFQYMAPGEPLFQTNFTNFAPRVGIAYRLTDTNVVRASYGLYYNNSPQLNNTFAASNPPNLVTYSFASSIANPLYSSNPFPIGLAVAGGVPSPAMAQYYAQTPAVNEWMFDYQHSFSNNLMLDISYAGNRGVHFGRTLTLNVPLAPGSGAIQSRRPLPDFGPIRYYQFDSYSTYNALQAKIEKRFSSGLYFLASYTWSRSLDLASNDLTGGTVDPNHLNRDYGPADFNVPQDLTISYIYQLPVGRGRHFLSSSRKLTDAFLGGWQVSGVTQFRSGWPFTVGAPGDVANVGLGTRPNRVCNGRLANPTISEWFDTSCFVLPAKYTFGNSGRGILTGPSFRDWDVGVMKNFHTYEQQYFQFRADFFNAFNNVSFGQPNSTIDVPGVGEILSASPGRTIQFGVKYEF